MQVDLQTTHQDSNAHLRTPNKVQRNDDIRVVEAEDLVNDLNTRKSIAGVKDFVGVVSIDADEAAGDSI